MQLKGIDDADERIVANRKIGLVFDIDLLYRVSIQPRVVSTMKVTSTAAVQVGMRDSVSWRYWWDPASPKFLCPFAGAEPKGCGGKIGELDGRVLALSGKREIGERSRDKL